MRLLALLNLTSSLLSIVMPFRTAVWTCSAWMTSAAACRISASSAVVSPPPRSRLKSLTNCLKRRAVVLRPSTPANSLPLRARARGEVVAGIIGLSVVSVDGASVAAVAVFGVPVKWPKPARARTVGGMFQSIKRVGR